jgi:hypothetical protein
MAKLQMGNAPPGDAQPNPQPGARNVMTGNQGPNQYSPNYSQSKNGLGRPAPTR